MNVQKHRGSRFLSLVLLITAIFFATTASAATLHAIIAADTNDTSIGRSVQIDLDKLRNLMQKISEHSGLTLKTHYISGNELSYNSVLGAINGLSSVGSDDVIFFFWNGHGKGEEGSVLPSMALEGGLLKLSKVRDILTQKGARLLIVIGDTCNKGSERSGEEARPFEKAENYRELFLKYRGTVLASSSKRGEYSYGNNTTGGVYTNQFLNSFGEEVASGGTPSWNTLMDRANATIKVAEGILQHPQSKVEVSYVSRPDSSTSSTTPPTPCRLGEDQTCSGSEDEGWTCVGPREKKGNQECCQTSAGTRKCIDVIW